MDGLAAMILLPPMLLLTLIFLRLLGLGLPNGQRLVEIGDIVEDSHRGGRWDGLRNEPMAIWTSAEGKICCCEGPKGVRERTLRKEPQSCQRARNDLGWSTSPRVLDLYYLTYIVDCTTRITVADSIGTL